MEPTGGPIEEVRGPGPTQGQAHKHDIPDALMHAPSLADAWALGFDPSQAPMGPATPSPYSKGSDPD